MKTIYVGLTGLSRAGKTVFLTSAIHELTSHTGEALREFKNSGWQFAGNPAPIHDGVDTFPYRDRLQGFRENPPQWPESTEDISEYRLHIKLLHADGKRREGHIVFVDYPGERLTDVALLDTRYENWSDDCFASLATPPETLTDSARDFLESVRTLAADAKGQVPEYKRQAAHHTFGNYAVAAREARCPVSPLEPVLKSISQKLRPFAPFFPLDSEMRKRMPSLCKIMTNEYARYLTATVWPFLNRIAACNHQIVLVDVLDILRSGPSKHDEVKEQLKKVLHCYRLANRSTFDPIIARIPFLSRRQISRVTFCATKADQATKDHRNNLESLLRALFNTAAKEIEYDSQIIRDICFRAISAHRCTDDEETNHEGKPVVALKGRLKEQNGQTDGLFFPGKVPVQWPLFDHEWKSFRFPDFLPRPLPSINAGRPLPSIKMDQVLFSIVEEFLK